MKLITHIRGVVFIRFSGGGGGCGDIDLEYLVKELGSVDLLKYRDLIYLGSVGFQVLLVHF